MLPLDHIHDSRESPIGDREGWTVPPIGRPCSENGRKLSIKFRLLKVNRGSTCWTERNFQTNLMSPQQSSLFLVGLPDAVFKLLQWRMTSSKNSINSKKYKKSEQRSLAKPWKINTPLYILDMAPTSVGGNFETKLDMKVRIISPQGSLGLRGSSLQKLPVKRSVHSEQNEQAKNNSLCGG